MASPHPHLPALKIKGVRVTTEKIATSLPLIIPQENILCCQQVEMQIKMYADAALCEVLTGKLLKMMKTVCVCA